MITEAIKIVSSGKHLENEQMQQVMEEIMSGQARTPDIVSFLTALSKKSETPEEITAAVSVLRRHVRKINTRQKIILDTCGTGADKSGTFNISTVAAFVASASGITVAKHGNRSVSSKSGSADVLEALGININLPPENLEKCLDEIGIAFLFAPNLHPAMKFAMPARKQIASRTIFNLLGPLTNPAGATHQLIGVYDKKLVRVLAEVLANLGTARALVVSGEDGLDEITTTSETFIAEENKGEVKTYKVAPEEFGFKRAGAIDLKGADAVFNAKILLEILKGESGPRRDIVLLNAAAAIYAAEQAGSIKEAIPMAKDALDSGKALEKLEALKKYSNQ